MIRWLNAGLAAGAIVFAAGIAQSQSAPITPGIAQSQSAPITPGIAPASRDIDHDRGVSILDLTLVAQYFGQPAEPCIRVVDVIHYATPITSFDTAGLPILVEGRSYLDPDSPYLADALAGTPIARCQ